MEIGGDSTGAKCAMSWRNGRLLHAFARKHCINSIASGRSVAAMSYYQQQTYQSTPYNPATSPSQNPPAQYPPQGSATSNVYSSPNKPPSPPPELPSAPTLPSVTPEVASRILHRLLSSELRNAGFDSAESSAMHRLELDVVACVVPSLELPINPLT